MEGWEEGLQKGFFPADFDFSKCPTHLGPDALQDADSGSLITYGMDYWKVFMSDYVPPTLSLGKHEHITASLT